MVIVLHKLLGGIILWTPLTLLGFYNDVGLKFSGNFNVYIVICIWVFINSICIMLHSSYSNIRMMMKYINLQINMLCLIIYDR